jgi:hypothetical protein
MSALQEISLGSSGHAPMEPNFGVHTDRLTKATLLIVSRKRASEVKFNTPTDRLRKF